MPKTTMDYSKCCIYKIEHENDESLLYVGHTNNFDKRKTAHKYNSENRKDKKFNIKLYQMIRGNGGWDMFKMIEVEKFPCKDKREAERRENEVMKELKANMNSMKSYLTEGEYEVMKQICDKKYYEKNKNKLNELKKEYYKDNKEKMNNQSKEYYINNKDRILEQRKETITCDCGCKVVRTNLKRHQATKKHFSSMNKI